MIGVYGVRNITENIWYIGSSVDIDLRINTHKKSIEERSGVFLGTHPVCEFEFKVLKELTTEIQLELWENYFIGFYNAIDNGYNSVLASRRPRKVTYTCLYTKSNDCLLLNKDNNPAYGLVNKLEIAKFFSVSTFQIDSWVEEKKIPFIMVGKRKRFSPTDVLLSFKDHE